ncbi:DUF2934 domain-containing protein [Mangrovibrevibacter kandeliae]|uniref:DUF2934 domain-containing protein n=1 Tax=Mangrovibrevibacter kandeliae TaxID=2968473 RepID=UPI002117DCC4|nr:MULTISPECIES: DUF2934 domain-containing protein [unclassified Aurantimonas]MCQ8781467.1 DUF2934 domain-containing protein [Aurantimonas sp. CSK15Z-1]MCW4114246.1 DUF2934 domain-containing protein [Aurantimonas sp. MSK8Z-1]
MTDDEARIRQKAYELWEAEGRPEGRQEEHWAEAKEIVALRDSFDTTLRPLDQTIDEPDEPEFIAEEQGDMPGLDDNGDGAKGPSWDNVRELADQRALEVEDKPATKKRRPPRAS